MNDCLHQLLIMYPSVLAAEGRYVHMGRRFRPGSSSVDLGDLMTVVSIIAIVAAISWLATRLVKHRENQNTNSPPRLFRELCRAHQLDWNSRQLLQALAHAHQLADPTMIFVTPQCFNTSTLNPAFGNRHARIEELGERLFSDREASTELT